MALFRMSQEALTNVLKHARASMVQITLAADAQWMSLTIADDGCGCDALSDTSHALPRAGLARNAGTPACRCGLVAHRIAKRRRHHADCMRAETAIVIKVLLADDHLILREGVAALLDAQDDISVVAHAQDGRDAVRKIAELKPDVAVMDIVMPELDGIEATRLIRASSTVTRVVILSMYSTTEHIFRALQAGASGYLLKESAGAELVAAIRSVFSGRRYLSQKITEAVVDDYIREHQSTDPLGKLSARERQILQLVAGGKSTAEIASTLFLSTKTVDTYRSRLMQKTGDRQLCRAREIRSNQLRQHNAAVTFVRSLCPRRQPINSRLGVPGGDSLGKEEIQEGPDAPQFGAMHHR